MTRIAGTVLGEVSRPAGLILLVGGLGAFLWVAVESFKLDKVRRERMFVVMILTFFSMLFWAFFEQAGSSINNFTDRNVDRVFQNKYVTETDVGKTIKFRIPPDTPDPELAKLPADTGATWPDLRQRERDAGKQIIKGVRVVEGEKAKLSKEDIEKLVAKIAPHKVLTMTGLTYLRDLANREDAGASGASFEWQVTQADLGMGVGRLGDARVAVPSRQSTTLHSAVRHRFHCPVELSRDARVGTKYAGEVFARPVAAGPRLRLFLSGTNRATSRAAWCRCTGCSWPTCSRRLANSASRPWVCRW